MHVHMNCSVAIASHSVRTTHPTTTMFRNSFKRFYHRSARPSDVTAFRQIVGREHVLTSEQELSIANVDWTGRYRGNASVVVKPRDAAQISKILKHCHDSSITVVVQGGNTGLVGGGVPIKNEVILSLSRMNSIIDFDPITGALQAEAGCILQTLDEYVGERNYMMPLDLGAKGSCHIGGNVATAAGGIRFLRYGSMHSNLLGLEVVLADGTILNEMSTLRKNNTGFHNSQLFVGSEGVLGVITGVSLLCPPRPTASNVAVLGCDSFDSVIAIMSQARTYLNEILSAMELMDQTCVNLVHQHLPHRLPLEKPSKFSVLLETQGSNADHDEEKVNTFLTAALESGHATDGIVAESLTQQAELWAIREGITESASKAGSVYKYDISLPTSTFYDIVPIVQERLDAKLKDRSCTAIGFGHVGDGNLHLNVIAPKYDSAVEEVLEPFVPEWTAEHGGSVSAEHGIGQSKVKYLPLNKSEASIRFMHALKQTLDPMGILNPGKVLSTMTI